MRGAPISGRGSHTEEGYNTSALILGEYYSRLCGISFSHVASNLSRLAILDQRGDAQALLSRTRCVSSKETSRWADDSAGPQGHLQRISLNSI